MTLFHDSKPIYGPYGSWSLLCDRTALDEIVLYGDVLSAVAASNGRLTLAEIDRALGLRGKSAAAARPDEAGPQRPSSSGGDCVI
jgi:hypothetical protein